MYVIPIIVGTIAFAVLAPVVGCLLAGLDRKLSARMQGRVGPPILQPYYDVRKLLEKDRAAVRRWRSPGRKNAAAARAIY